MSSQQFPPADTETAARSATVAQMIDYALRVEGYYEEEGAMGNRYAHYYFSDAVGSLEEWFREHGFSEVEAEVLRQVMRREPVYPLERTRMPVLLDLLRDWTGRFVLEMLEDAEPKAREIALRAVALSFRPVDSLVPFLNDPDATVRAIAVIIVTSKHRSGLSQQERETYRQQALADPSPKVRWAARYRPDFYGTAAAHRKLARHIENQADREVRNDHITCFAAEITRDLYQEDRRMDSFVGPEMKAILIRELNNDDRSVREAVAEALACLCGPDVTNALLDRLPEEESGDVRFAMRHHRGFIDVEVLDRALEVFNLRLAIEPEPWVRKKLGHLRRLFFQEVADVLRREEHEGKQRGVPNHTPEVAAAIQSRIGASTVESSENALSLFATSALYDYRIQPDGTVLCVDRESFRQETQVVPDGLVRFAAIVQGAARYPELRELIPTPPAGTYLSERCLGTGSDLGNAGQSCSLCNGYGWRMPGF
jgi:hypothetical protein